MKFNHHKSTTMKKVVKNGKSEMVSITIKHPHVAVTKAHSNKVADIAAIAKTLKARLSNVAKRLAVNNAIKLPEMMDINAGPSPMLSPYDNGSKQLSSGIMPSMDLPSPALSATICSHKSEPTDDLDISYTSSSSSSASKTMLAHADWPNHHQLQNLTLLKNYLTFVSQETSSIQMEKNTINFSFAPQNDTVEPETEIELASRHGATLIELSVHDPSMMTTQIPIIKKPNTATRRRRPGRPPKEDNQRQPKKSTTPTIIQRRQRSQMKKKEVVSCICEASHEEFGTMVQCDDCHHWLHLDCLALGQKALEETFRCPSCFIKLGHTTENNVQKLISHITWRYAAKLNSQVLALAKEEEEFEEFDEMEVDHHHLPSSLGINTTLTTKALSSSPHVVPCLLDMNLFRQYDETCPGDDFSDGTTASQDGGSEAGTPAEYHFGPNDDSWFCPPNAANVFLCENNMTKDTFNPTAISSAMTDAVPSALCQQDLPEFHLSWEGAF